FEVSYAHEGGAPVTLADEPRSRSHALLASILDPADGSYSVTITAVDRAQNSRSLTHSFVVDRSAPGLSMLAPANGVVAGGSQAMLEIRGAITAQHLKDWVLRYGATGVDPPQWTTIVAGASPPASEV